MQALDLLVWLVWLVCKELVLLLYFSIIPFLLKFYLVNTIDIALI